MTPAQWQQVKNLFHSALALAPEERAAYLDEACRDQDSLREEVETLIAAHQKSGSFIDSPAYEQATTLIKDEPELKTGQTVDSYEIIALLGRGGMGEVYLARDTRLNRKVALKFLPESFTEDMERLKRFTREARAASALNHPNIITIYEIGEAGPLHFIATEFIEGEMLRARLGHSKPDLNETLHIVIQIADALAASHAAGVVHRDLKPENIMLRPDGYVKVLDFGLAKHIAVDTSPIDSRDPMHAQLSTSPGMVMGTPSYMSPEQLRGLRADERTDIWSLGVVLHEMVTGQAPFIGPTIMDTVAGILEHEPPALTDQAPDAPAELQRIVRKALRKNRDDRYQTSEALLVDLRSLKKDLPQGAGRPRKVDSRGVSMINRRRLLVAGSILLVIVVAILIYKLLLPSNPADTRTDHTATTGVLKTTQITASLGLDLSPTFSPDGNSIAYSSDHSGSFEIYVKPLAPGGREIQLTADGEQNLYPAWSPDGKLIAYHSTNSGGIRIIPALGGTSRQITEFGSRPAWSPDASLVVFQSDGRMDMGATTGVAQRPSTIWVVPAQGGEARQITQAGNPAGGHGAASWSPDGRRILFCSGDGPNAVWTVSLKGDDLKQLTPRVSNVFGAIYYPDGQSIYYSGISQDANFGLWKLRISPDGNAAGEPVMLTNTGGASSKYLAISANGKKLAYSAVLTKSNLWSLPVSRNANIVSWPPSPLTSGTNLRTDHPAFSHDGRKMAFGAARAGADRNIWVMDADGENLAQVTTDPANDNFPTWFPDGDQIAFISDRHGRTGVWATSLKSGRDRLLLSPNQDISFARLSPDGKLIVFNSSKSGTINLWKASIEDGQVQQLTFDQELMGFPIWSPDGQFIAFMIRRGDDSHVAIIPSEGGAPTQLTFDHGLSFVASWSPDGDKLVFAGQRNGIWNIYSVSRTTREQKQLSNYTKPNTYVRYPSWSPLGNQIAFEYAETTGNIWIMDLK